MTERVSAIPTAAVRDAIGKQISGRRLAESWTVHFAGRDRFRRNRVRQDDPASPVRFGRRGCERHAVQHHLHAAATDLRRLCGGQSCEREGGAAGRYRGVCRSAGPEAKSVYQAVVLYDGSVAENDGRRPLSPLQKTFVSPYVLTLVFILGSELGN